MRLKGLFIIFVVLQFLSCRDKSKDQIVIEQPIFFPMIMEIDTLNVDSLIVRETDAFPTTLDGTLANNNTNKSKITSASLISLTLVIPDYVRGDTVNYCNFKDLSEISLYVKNDANGTKLSAQKLNIPDKIMYTLNMDIAPEELRDYLRSDDFRMVVSYRKRRPMPDKLEFFIIGKFMVYADPL